VRRRRWEVRIDGALDKRNGESMAQKSPEPNRKRVENGVTRRSFLGMSLASGATLLAGGSAAILGAASSTTRSLATNSVWKLGGDLVVNRLSFGAMRITGEGVWGWPA